MAHISFSTKYKPQSTTLSLAQLLKIGEQVSLWTAIAGTIAAAISQQIAYACVPLSVSMVLMNQNNRRRCELEEQIRQSTIETITTVQKITKSLESKTSDLGHTVQQLEQTQHDIIYSTQQSNTSVEQRLKKIDSDIDNFSESHQQNLTKTYLSQVLNNLHQLQHQQKVMELGIAQNMTKRIEEIQEQIKLLNDRTLTLQKQSQKYQQQNNKLQPEIQTQIIKYRDSRKKQPNRGKNERVAVFIDASNLYYAAKEHGNIKIEYSKLFSVIKAKSKSLRTYFYTGIDSSKNEQKQFLFDIQREGCYIVSKEVVKQPLGFKANLDVELALDMQMGAIIDCYDTAVLVSGDGDFIELVQRVKNLGKRVEVVSFRHNTSKTLIDIADSYLDLTEIKDQIQY